jgi:hypothetical protein
MDDAGLAVDAGAFDDIVFATKPIYIGQYKRDREGMCHSHDLQGVDGNDRPAIGGFLVNSTARLRSTSTLDIIM